MSFLDTTHSISLPATGSCGSERKPFESEFIRETFRATGSRFDEMATNSIRHKYRAIARLVQRLPEKQLDKSWKELRQSFRRPLAEGESLDARLKAADDRMSFLRMVTPKERPSSQGGKWVYKDGERLENQGGTLRDSNGRVVSNWDGKNLDPESVKRHNYQLKRAGFVNNAHAKGFF